MLIRERRLKPTPKPLALLPGRRALPQAREPRQIGATTRIPATLPLNLRIRQPGRGDSVAERLKAITPRRLAVLVLDECADATRLDRKGTHEALRPPGVC